MALTSASINAIVFGMKDTSDHIVDVMPSATPSDEEIRRWQALPRDEQLRRLRAVLTDPDCGIPTRDSMTEIVAEARARADLRRG